MNLILGGLLSVDPMDGAGYPVFSEIVFLKSKDCHWQHPGHKLQREWAATERVLVRVLDPLTRTFSRLRHQGTTRAGLFLAVCRPETIKDHIISIRVYRQ